MSEQELLKRAISLRENGQLKEACALFAELTVRFPDYAGGWYQLAWTHDAMGLEREAVPLYEKALNLGLPEEDDAGARLGLGSTLRTLGLYEASEQMLREGSECHPGHGEFAVFRAMALYNLGRHAEAMKLLLLQLADTSSDEGIRSYERALRFYSDKLDEKSV